MSRQSRDHRNCVLCRVLRGMAFGGIGAALFALPAKWLGAQQDTVIYSGLLGAIFLTALVNRKKPD